MRIKRFSLNFGSTLFKCLSDESRIRILALLYHNKELCSTDLELILDFTQTKTNRHLHYLKNNSLLTCRKVHHWTFYSIKDEAVDILEQIFSYLKKDPVIKKDLETCSILASNRELAHQKFKEMI